MNRCVGADIYRIFGAFNTQIVLFQCVSISVVNHVPARSDGLASNLRIASSVILVLEWLNKECFWKLDDYLIIVTLICGGLTHPGILGLLVCRCHINS